MAPAPVSSIRWGCWSAKPLTGATDRRATAGEGSAEGVDMESCRRVGVPRSSRASAYRRADPDAAVDIEHDAGDVTRFLRAEEGRRGRDVARIARMPGGDLGG